MKNLIRYSLSIMLAAAWLNGFSQQVKTIDVIQARMDSARIRRPVEKLYLHVDRSAYTKADTLWFKAYLLYADYLRASDSSGLAYVELDDEAGKCVKRTMIPVNEGLSWGSISLDDKDITEGNYVLRAYTNWMRNFGDDYIFTKKITISAPGNESRLIDINFTSQNDGDKRKVEAKLALTTLDKMPVRLKDIQLRVLDGKRTLANDRMTTGFDGSLSFNFELPAGSDARNLKVVTTDVGKNAMPVSTTIPILLNDEENTDVQFMPEGGTLIAGVSTKIGFKALAESGQGTAIQGKITNSHGKEAARFTSLHKGMGSFEMMPEKGQVYTAEILLKNGKVRRVLLPVVADAGSSLRVEDKGDSLRVTTFSSGPADGYYLIGQARGVVCYIARMELSGNNVIKSIPKSAFPTGIARFTLMNANKRPVNERIVFINHHDDLHIAFITNKATYHTADSIAVKIAVKDKEGRPVQGSFSASITDNSQSNPDSLGSNMANYLLLTSDLKGAIEDPGYYFKDAGAITATALDNLLLTQGWVGYIWDEVLIKLPEFKIAAEHGFSVQGTVVNVFSKPVSGAPLVMVSKSPSAIMEATTDDKGKFKFDGFMPIDTAAFLIQARNRRGKSFNIGIEVDRFNPPVFTSLKETFLPWYVNPNAVFVNSANNTIARRETDTTVNGRSRMLKEVKISGTKIIKGSKALRQGELYAIFDDADMQKKEVFTLLQILRKDVKGFGEMMRRGNLFFVINGLPVTFIIDGYAIDMLYQMPEYEAPGQFSYYNYIKSVLDYFMAEDMVGVEVYRKFAGFAIDITTRDGVGPYFKKIPGTTLYRPMAVNTYKQFYRPRYIVKTDAVKYDMRATIHWEPNIVTDRDGNALISFYAAGKPATYTIKIEGSDMSGQIGAVTGKIVVNSGTAP